MEFYNINNRKEVVNFSTAVNCGLGVNQGLYFPSVIPKFDSFEIKKILDMDFINRSAYILSKYIGDEISDECILKCISNAFNFPLSVVSINDKVSVFELFHGPTLAFKDFGSRFMAQIISEINDNHLITILTATSGDTGAAVAHAFYGIKNVRVVILYPYNKISYLQEKLFSTLGENIYVLAVDGDFDACQYLVKEAFNNDYLKCKLHLNSANSINISRLLPQICYYFELLSKLPVKYYGNLVLSIPSGNFGNLTAGLFAQSAGLPIKRFIIATNLNDTVPRFLCSGKWQPRNTITTLANAMDVSNPSNWSRVRELFIRNNWSFTKLSCEVVDDDMISKTIVNMAALGYISEPHASIAYYALQKQLHSDEFGVFLGTAHPAKFKDKIEAILGDKISVLLPPVVRHHITLPSLLRRIPAQFSYLYELLLSEFI